MGWVVRTQGDPYAMSEAIQESLRQSTGLPVSQVRSMADVVVRSTSRQRFNMWLMTMFGASALLLAAIGIYGLMAYSVEQRTQEIGIRLSLGADGGAVRRMVIVQGMRLAIVGVSLVSPRRGVWREFMTHVPVRSRGRATRWCSSACRCCLTVVAFVAVFLPALARQQGRSDRGAEIRVVPP